MSDAPAQTNWLTGQPVRVPWGAGELDLQLPADWPVFLAQPATATQPAPPLSAMLEAQLASPLGLPPLRQIGRDLAGSPARPGQVALVVDDDTRHTPAADVLSVVLEDLGAGRLLADERIEVHFAGGMHQPMNRQQMADKVGPAVVERFACFNNPFDQPGQYRRLGRTRHNTPVTLSARVADARLRILIGSVSGHMQAGFGGGLKLLFPGLASLDTLKKLHLRGTERFRQLVGLPAEQNPMRQEIERLGAYLDGVTFAVQLLLGPAHEPLAVAAGDPIAAQRALTVQAISRFGVELPGPADCLVTNSFPLEYDLWQGFKCIGNTLFAARPGAPVVALIKADHGAAGMNLPAWTVSRPLVRGLLRLTGRDGLLSLVGRLVPQINGEAKFFARFCLGTIQRNPVLVYSPNLLAGGIRFPGLELFDNLPAVWQRVRELLPGGSDGGPNVTVFGHGGVCYPLGQNH